MYCNPYIPPPPPKAGDVVYYANGTLNVTPLASYDSSMGTAVGVIVIPEGILPDGKARFVALQDATSSVAWSPKGTDTSLTNYTKVPTTDNAGTTTTGSNTTGYLPSDNTYFTGATSYVDPKTKYASKTPYIPSPYLEDGSLNPAYCEILSGGNALSDFNGKSNTDALVALGTAYTAVNAAKNYSIDGIDIDWYLPSAGELGFLVARFDTINESIAAAGGVAVRRGNYFWSSSEYDSNNVYYVYTSNGNVNYFNKNYSSNVRSFAML